MKIVFAGSIGRFPVGGHAWVDMQYLLGLRALGHDVYYLEDCGEQSWVYNWATETVTTDLDYPTMYLRSCLQPIGFGDRWIYRAGDHTAGMTTDDFLGVCSTASLFMVRGGRLEIWRPEYDRPRIRIYIDSDPGFTQFAIANGDPELQATIDHCDRLFSIGQRIGAPDCPIPENGRRWSRTVAPVFLPGWPVSGQEDATHFTTVMQWRSYRDVVYEGVKYGNKDREFPTFASLPGLTRQPLRLALTGATPDECSRYGWDVVLGWESSYTPNTYQTFVSTSRAEFAVAKHGYVATRGGWFSDRSVCYLASGRPVLVQDTGLSDWLPIGEGVLTFRDVPDAVAGIDAINSDYRRHRRTAREVAERYFSTDRVLPPLLEEALS